MRQRQGWDLRECPSVLQTVAGSDVQLHTHNGWGVRSHRHSTLNFAPHNTTNLTVRRLTFIIFTSEGSRLAAVYDSAAVRMRFRGSRLADSTPALTWQRGFASLCSAALDKDPKELLPFSV